LPEDTPSLHRNDDRHTHIGIRLQVRADDQWIHIEALGWNTVGFNFYHGHDITEHVLQLKRGLTHFEGTIAWRSRITSETVIQSLILNELIYEKTKGVANNKALQIRLIKLIRVTGMVEEKRKILASLGLNVQDAQISDMIAKRNLAHPMLHYGVRVQSENWSGVVANAMNMSSVVESLEKWANAIGKK